MALMLERMCSNFVFSSLVSPCWQNVLIYTETLPWLQNGNLDFFVISAILMMVLANSKGPTDNDAR